MELTFRTAFTILFLANFLIVATHRAQARKAGGDVSQKEEGAAIWIPLRLLGLAGWLSLFVYMINPRWMDWSSVVLPNWLRWVGVGIVTLVIPLAYWSTRAIGNNVTRTVVTREDHELITHGPYRWVRHPLYAVGILFFSGLSLIAANWFMATTLALALVLVILRIPREEAMLIERFGDAYRDYQRRTGRFFPRLRVGE